MTKICEVCASSFTVPSNRSETARFCSRACAAEGAKKPPNTTCTICGANFRLKPSQLARYERTLGVFCSVACTAAAKARAYEGVFNPNYKGKNTDSDGYRIFPPSAKRETGLDVGKLHQAVCCQQLGIRRIPRGFHVHHRDCDVLNNAPENLAVLSISDHKWLHKQYGVATLWAFMHKKINTELLVNWSDDKTRAETLLTLGVHEVERQRSYIEQSIDLFN